jgi:hypothetical protein
LRLLQVTSNLDPQDENRKYMENGKKLFLENEA